LFLIVLTVGLSFLLTYFLVPYAIKIGSHYKFLDFPDSRKTHKIPIVRIGGLAIFLGWIFTLLLFFFLKPSFFDFTDINSVFSFPELVFCGFLFFMIGFSDDIKRLSPYIRLFLQFMVASICWGSGLSIDYLNFNFLNFNFEPIQLSVVTSYLITSFFIVSLINAVNWWDGLDGLATGTTIISTFFLLLINLCFDNDYSLYNSLVISSFLGSLIGFLIYNHKPAKILMGDGGSYFLGFNLSYLVLFNNSYSAIGNYENFNQNFFPPLTIVVVLPILLDMLRVIFLRVTSLKLLFRPDRLHLHHNFLKMGLSERETIIQMYAIVFMVSSLSLLFLDIKFSNLIFFTIVLIFFIITFLNFKKMIY
tara:strand:- start:4 stop:1092 length:1089 start_codon:yes stop_codon:yes gene_type:complete